MAERTQYAPGTFCWSDLTTTDLQAAKAFYGALFGWQAVDLPIGEQMYYSMQQIDGKDVAAISPQPQQQREAGVPPTWNSYVSVTDADACARRAQELGATVHAPPFDVMQSGRMAVVQDPLGAWFELWQPRDHFGAQLVNQPGALSWNELATTDMDAAAQFYADLFGWSADQLGIGDQRYLVIKNAAVSNGGIRPLTSPGMPPHWLVYFGTEDIDAASAQVGELGGTVHLAPMDVGGGNNIAIAGDPQGAVFGLYSGRYD